MALTMLNKTSDGADKSARPGATTVEFLNGAFGPLAIPDKVRAAA
jgi:hypothetical protein